MRWIRLGATAVGVLSICTACRPGDPTPSDAIVVPYQFILEFSIEQEEGLDHTARARLYDITQAYDISGDAGTIELAGGDAVYADDIELDIETRTTLGTYIRVDYSQIIPAGKPSYPFELRRPDDEWIAADIPIPQAFEIDPIGEVAHSLGINSTVVTWSDAIEGARIDLSIRPITDDCMTILGGGEEGYVQSNVEDKGEYALDTSSYHSPDHDCTYELVIRRRHAVPVSGIWHVMGKDLPSQDVWAHGQQTERMTFVALQRD